MRPEDELLAAARDAAANAYAPYSQFEVGAAVEVADGRIFAAANVENASYGLSLCAETNAIAAAVSAGARQLVRLAVVGRSARDPSRRTLAMPCGRCRQIIAEFAAPDALILVAHVDGDDVLRLPAATLLPHAFAGHDIA